MTIIKYIRWLKTETWMLSGEGLATREKLTVCYTGLEKNMNYFAGLVFGENYTKRHLGLGKLWPPANMPASEQSGADIAVIECVGVLRKLFNRRNYLYIPAWVGGGFAIPDDFGKLEKNPSLESDLRRIRHDKLTCRCTQDLTQLEQFYFEMHKPFIQNRHRDTAFIPDFSDMKRLFKNRTLIMLDKDGTPVAGGMVSSKGEVGRLHFIGVKDGDIGAAPAGALPAVYYHAAKLLHGRGCRWMVLGYTRPFLDDGVMRYKKKWGFSVTSESPAGYYVKVLTPNDGAKAFLRSKPFLVEEQGSEYAVMFGSSYEDARQTLHGLESSRWPKHVDGIVLYSIEQNGRIGLVLKRKLEGDPLSPRS